MKFKFHLKPVRTFLLLLPLALNTTAFAGLVRTPLPCGSELFVLDLPMPLRDQNGCDICWLKSGSNYFELFVRATSGADINVPTMSLFLGYIAVQANRELDSVRRLYSLALAMPERGSIRYTEGGHFKNLLWLMRTPAPIAQVAETRENGEALKALSTSVEQRIRTLAQELQAASENPAQLVVPPPPLNKKQEEVFARGKIEVTQQILAFSAKASRNIKLHPRLKKAAELPHVHQRLALAKEKTEEPFVSATTFEATLVAAIRAGLPVSLSFGFDLTQPSSRSSWLKQNGFVLDVSPGSYPGLPYPYTDASLLAYRSRLLPRWLDSYPAPNLYQKATIVGHQAIVVGGEIKNDKIQELKLLNTWGDFGDQFLFMRRSYLLLHAIGLDLVTTKPAASN